MIRKSIARSFSNDKSIAPRMNAILTFDEKCCICDDEVPNGRLVLRHEPTRNIICLECMMKLAEVQ